MFSTSTHAKETVYDFKFDSLVSMENINLSDYQGKVILIVNTASKCGFTNQYHGLEKLYQKYKDQGFVVIGVPSNDFGSQEPGDNEKIANFCEINFGVSFPLTSKCIIKGDRAHPFYSWAKKELGFGTVPKWNFHKYLINRQGHLVDYYYSMTSPESSRLVKKIEKLLREN